MIFKKIAMGLTLSLSIITPVIAATPSMAATVTYSIPTGLKTVDQTPSSVELAWNAVADAPMYRVQYSLSPDFSDPSYVRSLEKTATVDMRGLKADTTYYFRVRVITTDGAGLSDYGPTITGKTLVTPPAPPALTNALSVATYNVHCANCDSDPAKSWYVRRDSVIANVNQECLTLLAFKKPRRGG
jgi:phosphodiesterase/alkaline phosphatase D-like protein